VIRVDVGEAEAEHELNLIALDGEQLVGVALSKQDGATIKLQSIIVEESHRRRNVATQLLAALEPHARDRGATRLEAMYESTHASAPILERLFARSSWSWPFAGMFMCRGTKKICEAQWMQASLPASDELFAWSELTDRERSGLHQTAPWWEESLGPFPNEPIEPVSSLGLRAGGEVIGWMLTHRMREDTIRYSRLFVREDSRTRARGVALIAEAIWRQVRAGIPYGYFIVRSDNTPMVRLLKRRIAPYLESVREARVAEKLL
jgi:GNAT superfamily N-acetyltransferase